MIKSSEKTQSTGNLRFALDAYPKHNVRDDITFFISFFNTEEIWKLLEIVAFFTPGMSKDHCQQIQKTSYCECILQSNVCHWKKKILFEEGIWQKQGNVDNSACRLIPFT